MISLYFNGSKQSLGVKARLLLRTILLLTKIRRIKRINNAILLTDYFSGGFFHWFGDVLQKLEAIGSNGYELREYIVIIPENFNLSYVERSLMPYGVSCCVVKQNEMLKLNNMIYIPQITPAGNYRPKLMKLMRTRFLAYYPMGSKDKRIYISRKKATKRRILNEREVEPILRKNGFEVVCMEDYSFIEQLKIVAQASVLVSLHGAGLTHMIWLPERSKILEIRLEGDTINNCYFSLASGLGLPYFYNLAQINDTSLSTQQADFIIDIDSFNKVLDQLLSY